MNPPEETEACAPCSRRGSLKKELLLNAWLLAVCLAYCVGLYLVKQHPGWSPGARVAVSLTPVIPGIFYIRAWLKLLRSLDELQRRNQLEGLLFAALGTVVVCVAINVLNTQGLSVGQPRDGLGMGGAFLTLLCLSLVGTSLLNLRYV